MPRDYRRNGATPLFAAIHCADGHVNSKCHQKHTHCSWLKVVERFFAKITHDRIRRGTIRSLRESEKGIADHIAGNNENPKAFQWVVTAEQIIGMAERAGNALNV